MFIFDSGSDCTFIQETYGMKKEIKAEDIKAIFFDIDGTLVPINGKHIPISARKSIETLRSKGIKTIIATGRHSSEIKGLPVMETKFDGYLTLNGSLCLDDTMQAYAGSSASMD